MTSTHDEDEENYSETKSYYIELIHSLDPSPDDRCWWDFKRRDTYRQLQEIVKLHDDSETSTASQRGRIHTRMVCSSLKDLYSYFEFVNSDEEAVWRRELPRYTELIVYQNSWSDDREYYMEDWNELSEEEKQAEGIGWVEDIELISLVALVVP